MPIFKRRPNLSPLDVPAPSTNPVDEGMRTPLPHTPLACSPILASMAMTPDTPALDLSPMQMTLSPAEDIYQGWTEQEDDLLLSYLSNPPRPLRHAFPPESLPPPEALDEITAQIMSSPDWPTDRSASLTRARLLELARKHAAADYQTGRKRDPLVVIPDSKAGMGKKPVRPRLGQASFGMSRQQHSMDSLYGDNEAGTFSEALRLSSTLQDTASTGTTHELGSIGSLSSPLDFTFSYNPATVVPDPPKPIHRTIPSTFPPRPVSLLQRGRSFTSQDLENMPLTITESSGSEDETMSPARPQGAKRTVSSPVSSFTMSSLSSSSSRATSEETHDLSGHTAVDAVFMRFGGLSKTRAMDNLASGFGTLQDVEIELEPESEPMTPLHASFFDTIDPFSQAHSSDGTATPAITLTADSPTLNADTPRLLAAGRISLPSRGSTIEDVEAAVSHVEVPVSHVEAPMSPVQAFAKLSLNPPTRAPPPGAPVAPSRQPREARQFIARSLSDGMLNNPSEAGHLPKVLPQSISLSRLAIKSEKIHFHRTKKEAHTLPRPMSKRQRGGNAPDLSVFVPRPGAKSWVDQLKSPFQHKPAGSGSALTPGAGRPPTPSSSGPGGV